jgi:hypothetical protein
MKKELTKAEIEKRFADINAQPAEVMTAEESASLAAAEAMDDGATVTLKEYQDEREYSGKLLVRIPKELHKSLVKEAKENGVSLNQYALYKLAK